MFKGGKFLNFCAAVILGLGALWMIGSANWNWQFSGIELWLLIVSLAGLWGSGLFYKRAWAMLGVAECAALLSFLLITPETYFKNIQWNLECSQIPCVRELGAGRVQISNIRAFRYKTPEDFLPGFKSEVYDINDLQSMDIAFSHWEPWGDLAAHMLLCFNFAGNRSLAVSFEPRVQKNLTGGQFLPGVYRRYGQMMLLSVPEDVLDLRSQYRGENLYRYRVSTGKDVMQQMFLAVVRKAAKLENGPQFYHSVNNNCTTGLLDVLRCDPRLRKWDWRQFINGYYDRYLFEQGFLEQRPGETFYSLKARSYVSGIK